MNYQERKLWRRLPKEERQRILNERKKNLETDILSQRPWLHREVVIATDCEDCLV